MRPRVLLGAVSVVGAALISACAASGEGGPAGPGPAGPPAGAPVASANVSMLSSGDGYGSTSNAFHPNDVFVLLNGTVTWNNSTGLSHNVNFASATGAPANITAFADGSAERTFTTSGTFNYQCTLHAGMTGVVRVQ